MIDLNNLTKEEILELEEQIKEYRKTERYLNEYEVTFCVQFNPDNHLDDCLASEEDFGDWLCNVIPTEIDRSFDLKKPEDVSDFIVVKKK